MPLVQASHLTKRFGALELFRDISFSVEKGEKVGLIAPNGSGKSTLLKILVGQENAEEGEVVYTRGTTVGYLSQSESFRQYPNILAACMSRLPTPIQEVIAGYEQAVSRSDAEEIARWSAEMDALQAWDIEREMTALLSQLRIPSVLAPTTGLSGGECKRIALAAVLLSRPDLLLLDEPTNHLDPDIIEWLEGYLSTSTLTLLMVTHDRYFLDAVCHAIMELTPQEMYRYEGNYTLYLTKKQEREEAFLREQQSLRNTYRRELEWMRRMPQARATKAKYRIDAFHEIENRLATTNTVQAPDLLQNNQYIGKKIFEAEHVYKSYGDKQLIANFTYNFARKDRVGIVGPNGVGKTTLIRLIMGDVLPDKGTVAVGETVRFGYFSQNSLDFPPGKKVIEVITEYAEYINNSGKKISASQLLTRFLFPPARQQDFVEKLSGGERRRLQLCRVLATQPNFLVLDEPTNDLDLPTLRVLEEYLQDFDGCLLVVSHDRYFIDNVVNHLFVLEGNGKVLDYPGNYTDYRIQYKKQHPSQKQPKATTAPKPTQERTKVKRSYKEQQEFEALEKEIEKLQSKLSELEQQMSSGSLPPEQLFTAGEEYENAKSLLDEKEMRWLELSMWD